MMNHVEIQLASTSSYQPEATQIQHWIDIALHNQASDTEIVVRIVDEAESSALNKQYRHKDGPTNILSFPYELPAEINLNLLGDLVICAPVIEQEALAQHKNLNDHWAHIIIHGVLHLIGYDHVDQDDAEEMEALEINLLQQLNIRNPYQQVCAV